MTDDRRYKQRGYQDHEDGGKSRGPASSQGMPRTRVVTSYKEPMRCDECGADLSTQFEVAETSRCPKCEAYLHTCRNCMNFDPSARWECTEPIEEKIPGKRSRNECSFFTMRTISVKDIGGSAPARTENHLKALEDLFKK